MLNAIHLLTTRLSGLQPLLVCVDDAHWGDSSSLRALSYLAGRLAGAPIALVVSMRADEPGAPEQLLDQLRAEPGIRRLSPAPLGPDSVAAMVRQRLPGADDEACRAATEATAGNPLYLAELLRAVADVRNGDVAGSIQRAALPSLGDQVARRIASVAEAAPALAERWRSSTTGDRWPSRPTWPGSRRNAPVDSAPPAPDRAPDTRTRSCSSTRLFAAPSTTR